MRSFGQKVLVVCAACLVLTSAGLAQNYKIRQSVSMNGQKSESTVYVRGARKRTEGGGFMGMGGDVATVEQCDLKRNIKISDKKRMYSIEPFDDGADTASTVKTAPTTKPKTAPTVKGGTVTYISNTADTGERKQMFGLTARRIKTSVSMEASPDACMKADMKIETDGWYVDLPEFSCPLISRPQMPPTPTAGSGGGCRDKIIFKTSGGGKIGFPLTETRTITNQGMSFTQSTETLEFTKAPLDAALFDIPDGYTLTGNSQDLYGIPDYAALMKSQSDDNEDRPNSSSTKNDGPIIKAKKAGVIRIGVYEPTNRSDETVSTTNLQSFLVRRLTSENVEAVAVGSESDARTANCDYVLSSDLSRLKQSTASKIGGILGKATNTSTSGSQNYEAQVDFKLVSLTDGKTVSSKASNKTGGNADRAAEAVLALEAQQIFSSIQK